MFSTKTYKLINNTLKDKLETDEMFFDIFESNFKNIKNIPFSNYGKLESSYPPYNIIENNTSSWTIEIAVAGFDKNELEISFDEDKKILTIIGKKEIIQDKINYLKKGIATRKFNISFNINKNTKISKSKLEKGILYIDLVLTHPELKKNIIIDIE